MARAYEWLGARAASTDGHNLNDSPTSSSQPSGPGPGKPGVTRTPSYSGYVFTALRPANWPAAACKCFSARLQSGATASPGRFKTVWVPRYQWRCSQPEPDSEDQAFRVKAQGIQVTRKARGALWGQRQMSDISRQVTLSRSAVIVGYYYNPDQRSGL